MLVASYNVSGRMPEVVPSAAGDHSNPGLSPRDKDGAARCFTAVMRDFEQIAPEVTPRLKQRLFSLRPDVAGK